MVRLVAYLLAVDSTGMGGWGGEDGGADWGGGWGGGRREPKRISSTDFRLTLPHDKEHAGSRCFECDGKEARTRKKGYKNAPFAADSGSV